MARKRKKKKRRERRLNNVQKPASKRPSKLRQWTDDGMVRALNAVQSGILGVNEAARDYKIPPTTLKDRLSGRVIHGTNMGATGSTSTVGTATGSTSTVGMATGSTSTVGTATDSTSTVGTATGFRTTSVCPFNPAKPVTFSAETVKKFERRFENGYNIYTDPAYVQWMRMYHPDHLPPG